MCRWPGRFAEQLEFDFLRKTWTPTVLEIVLTNREPLHSLYTAKRTVVKHFFSTRWIDEFVIQYMRSMFMARALPWTYTHNRDSWDTRDLLSPHGLNEKLIKNNSTVQKARIQLIESRFGHLPLFVRDFHCICSPWKRFYNSRLLVTSLWFCASVYSNLSSHNHHGMLFMWREASFVCVAVRG